MSKLTEKTMVLHYEDRDEVEKVTGAQFDALVELERGGEA